MDTGKRRPIPLCMMTVVVDREKRERVQKLLEGSKVFFNLMVLGRGTANSRILGYLGLGETEKAVLLCILPRFLAAQLVPKLDEALALKKPGHGIVYVTNIEHGCYHRVVKPPLDEDGGDLMQANTTHDLIIVVLNRGYTDDVMDAARSAGATGGTVLHAKGCGLSGAEKFFGVTIQPEKEMILIVAKNDISCGIMQAIADANGPGTDPGAVSFSMPVTAALGVGSDVPTEILE